MIRPPRHPERNVGRRPVLRRRREAPGADMVTRRELLFRVRRHSAPTGRWLVQVDPEQCSDCTACVRICPHDALTRRRNADNVVYSLDPARCDGCGDCAEVCATRALHVSAASGPASMVEAVSLAVALCSRCGQAQAGLVGGRCVICRWGDMWNGEGGSRLR